VATDTEPGAVRSALRTLEGREVNLALADGSRLDGAMLISAGRGHSGSVWVYAGGIDVFLPRSAITDAWEAPPVRARSAA
jgi:hypothetical protein